MNSKKTLYIQAQVESSDEAKELLDKLKALLDEYEITINLQVCPAHSELYTLT